MLRLSSSPSALWKNTEKFIIFNPEIARKINVSYHLVSDFHEVYDSAEELQPGGLDLLVPSAKEKNKTKCEIMLSQNIGNNSERKVDIIFFGFGQTFLFLHSVFFLWLSGGCIVYFCVKHGGGLNTSISTTYLLSYVASRISLLPVLGRDQIVYFLVRTQEGIFCGSDSSHNFPYG